jgi:phage/plasmid-like protein (TIGR03299 family)
MSEYTNDYLRQNVKVGFTGQRGPAWWAAVGNEMSDNAHFEGAVPWIEVRKLFSFEAARAQVARVVDGKVQYEGDEPQLIPGMIELYHSETGHSFGTFSEGYQEHQFQDVLLGMVSEIVSDTLQIGSAGLLKYGAVGWVQVELPETIELTKIGEKFRPSLLAASSHDGSIANTYKRVVTRVVCDNTLKAGLGEDSATFRFRHSKNSKEDRQGKISAAREAANIVELIAGEYEAEAMALCAREVSPKAWDKFLDLTFPLKENPTKNAQLFHDKQRNAMNALWHSDERAAPWSGTAWGVLQASSTYRQHEAAVRKVSRAERNFESMVFGGFEKEDNKTLETLEKALALV